MINLNDNIKVNTGKPVDAKYLNLSNVPYVSTAEAIVTIPISERYRGLTVNVAGIEYYWRDGVADEQLIIKETQINLTSSGTGVTFTVDYATEVNQPLTGAAVRIPTQTAGGTAPVNGNTILCYNQSNATQNGVYVYNSAGAWARSTSMDNISELFTGLTVAARNTSTGSVSSEVYMLTSPVFGSGPLGSLPMYFAKITADQAYLKANANSNVNYFAQGKIINSEQSEIIGDATVSAAAGLTIIGATNSVIDVDDVNGIDIVNPITLVGTKDLTVSVNANTPATVYVPRLNITDIPNQSNFEEIKPLYVDAVGQVKQRSNPIDVFEYWRAVPASSTPDSLGLRFSTGTTFTPVSNATATPYGAYLRYRSAANTANTVGLLTSSTIYRRTITSATYKCIFAFFDINVAHSQFIGLSSTMSAASNINPSDEINCVYVGVNPGDTTLKIGHNDSSGTATIIDTSIPYSDSRVYYLEMFCGRNSNIFKIFVKELVSEQVYSTIVSTNIPDIGNDLQFYIKSRNTTDADYVYIHTYLHDIIRQFND